jgi:ATP/ADP translocase
MKKASTFAKAVTTAGGDAYGLTLKLLIAGVVASGGVMVGCHKFVQDKVMTDPECVDPRAAKKSKTKVSFVVLSKNFSCRLESTFGAVSLV